MVGYRAFGQSRSGAPSQRATARPSKGASRRPSAVQSEGEADHARLAALAQAGDRSALDQLLAAYRPLVSSVARGRLQLPSGVEKSDVEQEAVCAFCELVLEYEGTRRVPLAAYLKAKLGWRVAHFLRDEARRTGHLPLDAVDLDALPNAIVETPTPGIANPRIARALRRLSPRQRAVIAGLYWRDRKAEELAVELGVTHQAVSSLRRRAESTIRREVLAGSDDA